MAKGTGSVKPPQALLLDFDGTLADTLPTMRRAYHQFLHTHAGVAGSDAEFDELNGPPLSAIVSTLKQRYRLAQSEDQLHQAYLQQVAQAYATAQPSAGVEQIVMKAASCKCAVAVVTSSARILVEDWLARHRLHEHITAIIDGEMVSHGKPHPEPYHQALAQLHCNASDAVAVEDSAAGITAATDAGIARIYAYGSAAGEQSGVVLPLHHFDELALLWQ